VSSTGFSLEAIEVNPRSSRGSCRGIFADPVAAGVRLPVDCAARAQADPGDGALQAALSKGDSIMLTSGIFGRVDEILLTTT
jgi:hypothetical protein